MDAERGKIEVEGAKTFQELLNHGLASVAKHIELAKQNHAETQTMADKDGVAIWDESTKAKFFQNLLMLKRYGLDDYAMMNETDQQLARPCSIDLRGAYCAGAHFEGADCRGANSEGADFENAHFNGADCRGAHFDGANCENTQFEKAYCENAHFNGAYCWNANFERAYCENAHFDGANCEFAVFRLSDAPGATFQNARLKSADIRDMNVFSDTNFGVPGEQIEAERLRSSAEKWLAAADANLRIKHSWRSSGYYQEADRYQFDEMKCRRRAKKGVAKHLDYLFFYLIAGYGVKLSHPLMWIGSVIVAFGILFTGSFLGEGVYIKQAIGNGFYYSVISFTTLGLGEVHLASGTWINALICIEALLGITLMPLFIVAYARRILQG